MKTHSPQQHQSETRSHERERVDYAIGHPLARARGHNLRISTLPLATLLLLLGAGCTKSAVERADDGHGHAATPTATAPAAGAVKQCEHTMALAECGICKPELAAQLKPGESVKVRLASAESGRIVGLETALPQPGALGESVECLAEVSFNQNRLAQIVAPVGGTLHSVEVDLGGRVEEQQPVARIWSATVAENVARAVLTHQTLARERRLRGERVTAEKDVQEAEATHRAACQALRTLGFSEAEIDELSARPAEQVLVTVRAPFAGEIVERTAVPGALVEAGRGLFTLADRTTMWAMLQLPESALAQVSEGQAVELRVDSLPDRVFTGRLTWIGAAIDERTRLVRARAEFANPDGVLRDKMFATARILTRPAGAALLVPPTAIQHVAGRPLVFVKLADDLYAARAVALGTRRDGRQEILAGLRADEPVAITRAFALKSALLISRLGAGCADD